MSQNDSGSNILNAAAGVGTEHSPTKDTIDFERNREVNINLTDPFFFANLSWAAGVDYVNSKHRNSRKTSKFLGMQGACSDVIWRYYRKQALERIKLRQIYETKMSVTEQLVKKTLSNETIVAN